MSGWAERPYALGKVHLSPNTAIFYSYGTSLWSEAADTCNAQHKKNSGMVITSRKADLLTALLSKT
jgi:hypothetical protein